MSTLNLPVSIQNATRSLFAVLIATTTAGARAEEPSPWFIGGSQSITHDSNVLRVANGPSDTYSTTGLLGGFDQSIGRQHVYATGNVRYSKYREQDSQNNTSYGVNAGWDWATLDKLSGSLNANANRGLASLNGNAVQPSSGRNLLKTDQVAASARWGGEGLLSFDGNYSHSRVNYSAPEYFTSKSSGDAASLGSYFKLSTDLKVGAAVRYTRTETPYAIATVATPVAPGDYAPNTATGRNFDLSADWRYTVQSGINARLSWTRQSNSAASGQDFSGLTGSVLASYAPTAKLGFTASLSRDVGNNGSFFNGIRPAASTTTPQTGTQLGVLSENTQVTDGAALGATFAATAKIGLSAGLQYRRAKVVNAVSTGAANSEQNDTLRGASLGVNYAIARNWQLGCNYGHESRSLSGAGTVGYIDNNVGCSAQFTLR